MTPPTDPIGGALADRYRMERELGAGGMATVHRAHDLRHDRKVTMKVLKPELAAVIGASRVTAAYLRIIPRWVSRMEQLVDEANR